MSNNPKVAVVTAAYNSDRSIEATIRSVLGQSFSNFEYVIVDDNSTDSTLTIALSHARLDPRLRILRQPANQGPGAARNHGVAATTAPLIAFIDSDDCWEPDFLSVMLTELLHQGSHCVGVFCHSTIIDVNGVPTGTKQVCSEGPYDFFDFFRHIFPPGNGSAFLLHRKYFNEARGFSDLRSMEDLDLYLRILLPSQRHFSCVPRTLVRYRTSSAGLSFNGRYIEAAWSSRIDGYVRPLPHHQRWVIYYNFSRFYGPRAADTQELGTRLMRRALINTRSPQELFHDFGLMIPVAAMGWRHYLASRRFLRRMLDLRKQLPITQE